MPFSCTACGFIYIYQFYTCLYELVGLYWQKLETLWINSNLITATVLIPVKWGITNELLMNYYQTD